MEYCNFFSIVQSVAAGSLISAGARTKRVDRLRVLGSCRRTKICRRGPRSREEGSDTLSSLRNAWDSLWGRKGMEAD